MTYQPVPLVWLRVREEKNGVTAGVEAGVQFFLPLGVP